VLIALLSLGIAAAVRDSAVAIGLVLGLLYLAPIITQIVISNPVWYHRIERCAPMPAGLGHPGHHRAAPPAHHPLGASACSPPAPPGAAGGRALLRSRGA
jgi:ABC-2 type transport system permease protein